MRLGRSLSDIGLVGVPLMDPNSQQITGRPRCTDLQLWVLHSYRLSTRQVYPGASNHVVVMLMRTFLPQQ
jgi:hypothetical protein